MTSLIETIKAKVDVVEEIGLVVALSKSGKSFKGLCPFHNERTPSFYVFAEITERGVVLAAMKAEISSPLSRSSKVLSFAKPCITWLKRQESLLKMKGDATRKRNARAVLPGSVCVSSMKTRCCGFIKCCCARKKVPRRERMCRNAASQQNSVVAFGLGYAPEQWDGLSRYLLGRGYTEREMVSGGLARDRDGGLGTGGGVYDYFRHRLIFPIRDTRGRVIGFGGRAFGDDKPKYLNSPQTLLFEKNSVLYALDMARDAIKQAKQVVIVEGYVDAVIAHQYGTKQTVACIGSAITEKHIQQLKKLTKQVTLALDPDAAGEAATEHGIQEVLKTFDRTVVAVPVAPSPTSSGGRKRIEPRGIIRLEEQVDAEINVLQLPPGEDPDEVIIHNFATWSYAVSHPLPLVDYYFMAKTAGLNLREPNGKAEAAKRLLPVIGMITDRIKRDAYLRKLSTMISIEERVLFDELQRVLRGQKSNSVVAQFSAPVQTLQVSRGGTPPLDARSPQARDGESGESEPDWVKEKEPGERGKREERQSSGGLDRRRENKLQWEDYLIGLLLLKSWVKSACLWYNQ